MGKTRARIELFQWVTLEGVEKILVPFDFVAWFVASSFA